MGRHEEIPLGVQERVGEARTALAAAEGELESAMRAIDSADRAEKRIISERLQAAFDEVKTARKVLDDLLRDA